MIELKVQLTEKDGSVYIGIKTEKETKKETQKEMVTAQILVREIGKLWIELCKTQSKDYPC